MYEPYIVSFLDRSQYSLDDLYRLRNGTVAQANKNAHIRHYLNLCIAIHDDKDFPAYLKEDIQMTLNCYRPTRLERTESPARDRLIRDASSFFSPGSSDNGFYGLLVMPPAHENPSPLESNLQAPAPKPLPLAGPIIQRIYRETSRTICIAQTGAWGYKEVTVKDQVKMTKEIIRKEIAEKKHKKNEKRKRDMENFWGIRQLPCLMRRNGSYRTPILRV